MRPLTEELPGRHRHWMAVFVVGCVILMRVIDDQQPGEDVTDQPPVVILTTEEFEATCADYGLNPDGTGDGLPGVDA